MSISDHNFNDIAAKRAKKKREAPFSLRLSFEERAALQKAANGIPLGAYIKAVLFDQDLPTVRRRSTNPVKDHEALARVLGTLGASRLSSNLNQMARAVNTGSLPVSPEVEAQLVEACEAIQEMKQELLQALGNRPSGGEP